MNTTIKINVPNHGTMCDLLDHFDTLEEGTIRYLAVGTAVIMCYNQYDSSVWEDHKGVIAATGYYANEDMSGWFEVQDMTPQDWYMFNH